MNELPSSASAELVPSGDGGGNIIYRIVRYTVLMAQFTAASWALNRVADQVDGTYSYLTDCADSVKTIADQMARLTVDPDTTGEHRQVAAIMQAIHDNGKALTAGNKEMAVMFEATRGAHETDYGPLVDTIHNMPVEMADAEFYSNR